MRILINLGICVSTLHYACSLSACLLLFVCSPSCHLYAFYTPFVLTYSFFFDNEFRGYSYCKNELYEFLETLDAVLWIFSRHSANCTSIDRKSFVPALLKTVLVFLNAAKLISNISYNAAVRSLLVWEFCACVNCCSNSKSFNGFHNFVQFIFRV